MRRIWSNSRSTCHEQGRMRAVRRARAVDDTCRCLLVQRTGAGQRIDSAGSKLRRAFVGAFRARTGRFERTRSVPGVRPRRARSQPGIRAAHGVPRAALGARGNPRLRHAQRRILRSVRTHERAQRYTAARSLRGSRRARALAERCLSWACHAGHAAPTHGGGRRLGPARARNLRIRAGREPRAFLRAGVPRGPLGGARRPLARHDARLHAPPGPARERRAHAVLFRDPRPRHQRADRHTLGRQRERAATKAVRHRAALDRTGCGDLVPTLEEPFTRWLRSALRARDRRAERQHAAWSDQRILGRLRALASVLEASHRSYNPNTRLASVQLNKMYWRQNKVEVAVCEAGRSSARRDWLFQNATFRDARRILLEV